MSQLALPQIHRLAPIAPVILRVTVGLVMTLHGWSKLTEMTPSGFASGMLAPMGVPAPELMAFLVTFAELIGGLFLLVGFLTRLSAIAHIVLLTLATVMVKLDLGIIAPLGSQLPGAELDLALIAGALGVVLLGPGKPSVDHVIGIEKTSAELTRA